MEKYEIIIVGAGASGLASSWYLVNSGLNVACFEQGDFLKKEKIIELDLGGELQRFNSLSFDPNIRNSNCDYYIDSAQSPIHIANFNGVGGSTILFSGQYPRLKPSDFLVKTHEDLASDWPINYEDLLPFYELNDQMTGVSGLSGDIKDPFFKSLMPPVPFGEMGRKLIKGFDTLNWHWWPAYSAINTVPFNERPADDYSRPSNLGGDLKGGKGSTNHTYLPQALDKGLILKTNCKVIKLIKNSKTNSIKKIIYINENGKESVAKADIIILAASGIGTPRLLLSSTDDLNHKGIANSSDLVGRNLMLHPLGYVEGHFRENLRSNSGPQGCCILSQEFYDSDIKRGFHRGYTFQIIRGPLPIEAALNFTSRKLVNFGQDFFTAFNSLYNHTAHMTVITEDLPELHNRVLISKRNFDKFNNPGIEIHYKLSENTKNMLIHGLNNGRKLMKAANAYKSFIMGPVRNTGWHTLGTCSMGKDPSSSVVNEFGKAHDVENLFILDGSVFPTSGGVNPASTIQAMALYISEKIISRYISLIKK